MPDTPVNMAKPSQPKVDWAALALQAAGTAVTPDFSIRTTPADGTVPMASGGVNAQAQIEAEARAQQMAQATMWTNLLARMGGPVVGMKAGAALGTALGGPGPGTAIGLVGGGLIGGFMGDDFAQGREMQAGQRQERNPVQSAAVAVGNMIPGGAIAKGGMAAVPMAVATGLPANAAGSLLVQASEGNGLSATRTLDEAVLGTAMGVGIGGAFRGATRVAQSPAVRRAVGRLIADETGALRVYHASPHEFDKFDMEKVGTGEGAQAFGHGLYFAKNKDTANWYLRTFKDQGRGGRMYEVDLDVDESRLVDWDKPIADQPQSVRAATQKIIDGKYGRGVFAEWARNGADYRDLLDNFDDIDGPELSALLRDAGVPGVKYLDRDSRINVAANSKWSVENIAGDGHAINHMVFDTEAEARKYASKKKPELAPYGYVSSNVAPRRQRPTNHNIVIFDDKLVDIVSRDGRPLKSSPIGDVVSSMRRAVTKLATDETGSVGPRVPEPEQPEPGPRQAFRPEKPLDPQNLPEVIEPRRPLEPAQVQEDVERTFRRNTEFLGMEPGLARKLAEDSATPEAQVQKRRIMPVSEMQAKANQIEAVIPAKGKALNAEQQLALADHVKSLADDLDTLNQRVGDLDTLKTRVLANDPEAVAHVDALSKELGVEGLTGIERAQLERFDQLAQWQLADEAVGSEWGRAGRARQVLAKHRHLDDVSFLKQAYEMGLPRPEALDALSKLRGDPAAQRQFLVDLYKPSGQEYWKAYLAGNMLSGPPTLGVNLLSNAVNYARKESARWQAVGMDKATHKGQRVLMAPPGSLVASAYADGMRHAGRAFVNVMKTGVTPWEATSIGSGHEVFKGSWLSKALTATGFDERMAKEIGEGAANGVKRTLLGTDAAFQILAIYPEAYRRATAEAWNGGLRGADLAQAIIEKVKGLDIGSDVAKPLRDYSREVTFSGEAGIITKKLQQFVNGIDSLTVTASDKMWMARTGMNKDTFKPGSHYGLVQLPLGYLHLPFVRIAGQLFKQTLETSIYGGPAGAFKLGLGEGDRALNLQRVAEASQFYALVAVIASLYDAGVIDFTADPPKNDFEREQFYGPQGKTPWAIGVNGRYVPLQSLGAVGMALAPLGQYLNAAKTGSPDTPQRFTEATAAVARVQLNASTVRSVMTVFEGLSDPRKQEKLLGNYVSQFLPAGAAQRNARDFIDTTLRDPGGDGAARRFAGTKLAPFSGIVEEVEAQVPGLSTRVRPRLNSWGQPIQKQGPGKRLIGSVSTGEDFVGQELMKLKESLPDVAREREGVYPTELAGAFTSFEKTFEGKIFDALQKDGAAPKDFSWRFSDRDRQRYMRLVGDGVHQTLKAFITPDNPQWMSLTPEQKKAMVQELKSVGKEIGQQVFMESFGRP